MQRSWLDEFEEPSARKSTLTGFGREGVCALGKPSTYVTLAIVNMYPLNRDHIPQDEMSFPDALWYLGRDPNTVAASGCLYGPLPQP